MVGKLLRGSAQLALIGFGLYLISGFNLLVMGILIGIFALLFAWDAVWTEVARTSARAQWKRKPCEHGIPGGETQDKCEQCRREKEAARARSRRKRKEQERKAKITKKADRLRDEEVQRLTRQMVRAKEELLDLSPGDFEDAVAEMYRALGYSVTQTPMVGDQGRDAVIRKNGKTWLVECKRYARNRRVGRPTLQKLLGAVTEVEADGGIVVCTCSFAATALEYGKKYGIALVDLERLAALMQEAFPQESEIVSVRVMCRECGEVVHFDTANPAEATDCPNGHEVENELRHVTLNPSVLSVLARL